LEKTREKCLWHKITGRGNRSYQKGGAGLERGVRIHPPEAGRKRK